jgi:hypothetical protein
MTEPTLKEFLANLRGRSFKRYPDGRYFLLKEGEKVVNIDLKDYL